jgi:SOS-response transcriptional repressor LexA
MWMDVVHSKGKDTWYTLRVVGDSMSPDYLDGDIVLMDYTLQPHDGDVVSALVDGGESSVSLDLLVRSLLTLNASRDN